MRKRVAPGGEEGAIVILFALLVPVLILLAMITVDTADWFVKKRQLQIKADAAALAGAGELMDAFDTTTGICGDSMVGPTVVEFGGAERNPSLGGPATDARTLPELTTSPCGDKAVDVTVTESEVPFLFSLVPGATLESIKARARVDFQQAGLHSGVIPLAVPGAPTTTAVRIVSGGTTYNGVVRPGTVTDAAGRREYTFDVAGVNVAGTPSVDVKIGGGDWLTGMARIRSYPASATPSPAATGAPVLKDVRLNPSGGCVNDWSRPYYFAQGAACTVGMSAQVVWNTSVTDPALQVVTAYASTANKPFNSLPFVLVWDAPTSRYVSPALMPVPAGLGTQTFFLEYKQTQGKIGSDACPVKCDKTPFESSSPVQYAYSSASDELARVEVGEGALNLNSGQNSLTTGAHTLTVRIAVTSNLSLGGGVRTLRPSAVNQTFAFDCGNGSFSGSLGGAGGGGADCPTFALHTRADTADCSGTPEPPDCVKADPGNKAGQIDRGLKDRIYGLNQNFCGLDEVNAYPGVDGDKRLVSLILVDYDAFRGQGAEKFPIRGFAYFYITGWTDNQGKRSTCPGDEFPTNINLTGTDKAFIFGRYVKHLENVGPGVGGSNIACRFNDVNGCVAVMTH
jgi:hypothetical protein